MWLCGRDFLGAELLLPPLGLPTLDLGLRLRDVRGQLSLLVPEPLLELGQRLFALLELVGADLHVGRELGLAQRSEERRVGKSVEVARRRSVVEVAARVIGA